MGLKNSQGHILRIRNRSLWPKPRKNVKKGGAWLKGVKRRFREANVGPQKGEKV